jgi:hypothetical protein
VYFSMYVRVARELPRVSMFLGLTRILFTIAHTSGAATGQVAPSNLNGSIPPG